jgi:starch synthase
MIIPSFILTNDWVTGFIPALGRHQFGSAFNETRFIHVIHTIDTGYNGKIWANNNDYCGLAYIRCLPEDIVVDYYDNSIDPSRAALMCCDQWVTLSKRYRDDLLQTSAYRDLLHRVPEPFAHSNVSDSKKDFYKLNNLDYLTKKQKQLFKKDILGNQILGSAYLFLLDVLYSRKVFILFVTCLNISIIFIKENYNLSLEDRLLQMIKTMVDIVNLKWGI